MAEGNVKREVSVLVTDLDNSLWDWFEIWHSSFEPMLVELHRVTNVPIDVLKAQIKVVHQRHHTSEYSQLLQELPVLQERFGTKFDPKVKLDSVVYAFRKGRKAVSKLYPGVKETLDYIKGKGAITVGYTDSQFYYTTQRIRTLGLDGHLDYLYSTASSEITEDDLKQLRKNPNEFYDLKETQAHILPIASKKPDTAVLSQILDRLKVDASLAIYVGDDLRKDISMANAAGVTSVHAVYGVSHKDPRYQLLKDVTHWADQDVKSQQDTSGAAFLPSYVINSFRELTEIFEFVRYEPGRSVAG